MRWCTQLHACPSVAVAVTVAVAAAAGTIRHRVDTRDTAVTKLLLLLLLLPKSPRGLVWAGLHQSSSTPWTTWLAGAPLCYFVFFIYNDHLLSLSLWQRRRRRHHLLI